jgi:hypothetical protein
MRVDDEMCHKLLKEYEFKVNSESGFSNYCDMFVKYLSGSKQSDEEHVNINGDTQHGRRAVAVAERSRFPFRFK